MHLDFNKPFAEVFGHPKAKYEQFGRLYGPNGDSIDTPTIHLSTSTKTNTHPQAKR